MALTLSLPWWRTDSYTDPSAIPPELSEDLLGPEGFALVRVWPNGTTSEGWGLQGKNGAPGFMTRYKSGEFNPRRILYGYDRDKWAFAFVMRSMRVVVIDIDGKNGGLEHADELLANSPPTLAETSKSGNGYHLFYRTDEVWDSAGGFGAYQDVIGIVQGVDVRAVGCVYHHKTQRWNTRAIAPLPEYIAERLRHKVALRQASSNAISSALEMDEMEILLMHDELLRELARPIPAGKRNNTLFAIGTKLYQAKVPDWEIKLRDRAHEVGLTYAEAEKIVNNIQAYA